MDDPTAQAGDPEPVGRAGTAPLDEAVAHVAADVTAAAVPEWHRLAVDAARRVEDDLFSPDGDPEPVGLVRDLTFDSSRLPVGGDADVPVRVYVPEGVAPGEPEAPTLVFCHGGCWAMGTLDSVGDVCRRLCRRANCVVVSVDYRLAPEHPFPAGLDDVTAALSWVRETAPTFGGDPERVGVAGTSAGATLAAGVALRAAREPAVPEPACQCLLYPATDPEMTGDAAVENAEGPLLTAADMTHYWGLYLDSTAHAANPLAAPARAGPADLADAAPATVVTAGHDPLRDDGADYAAALADAGVAVRHRHYPAMAHGFCSLTESVAAADEALSTVADDVADLLGG
ncbi:MAG: alpha/beta hydrolase fold domain-containing protein [Halolamina sp.]